MNTHLRHKIWMIGKLIDSIWRLIRWKFSCFLVSLRSCSEWASELCLTSLSLLWPSLSFIGINQRGFRKVFSLFEVLKIVFNVSKNLLNKKAFKTFINTLKTFPKNWKTYQKSKHFFRLHQRKFQRTTKPFFNASILLWRSSRSALNRETYFWIIF